MRHADLAEVLAIEARAFVDPWPRQAFESDLADPALAFMRVARIDGRVAGYLVAWRVAGELHLTNLAVDEGHRRQGVAQGLLDALLAEAAAIAATAITLEVRRSNEAAIALYERNGFGRVAVRRNYYHAGGEDAVVMQRMLGEEESP